MGRRIRFELTPMQAAQYVPPPDLGPNVSEAEYAPQRLNNERAAGEHGELFEHQREIPVGGAGPITVTQNGRGRRWPDL